MEKNNLTIEQMQAEMAPDNSEALKELPKLVLKIKEHTDMAKIIDKSLKEVKAELGELEDKALQILLDNQMDHFSNAEGTVKLSTRRSTKKPAHGSPEWDSLKDYLMINELWEDMATVNANTLNSWYNQEMEKNKDDPTFEIPGCEKKEYTKVKFSKAKV